MSSASKYDLIVVGGGPAGTAAAIVAGRKGRRVLLLERGRFPRHKVCGEFVSAESLALLKVLLDPRHAALLRDLVHGLSQAGLCRRQASCLHRLHAVLGLGVVGAQHDS